MKLTSTITAVLVLSILVIVSCNKEKSAINAKAEATKDAIDKEKRDVNTAAANATQQTDHNAAVDKANIEAAKTIAQAQLDADKIKADAEAAAAKTKLDAAAK